MFLFFFAFLAGDRPPRETAGHWNSSRRGLHRGPCAQPGGRGPGRLRGGPHVELPPDFRPVRRLHPPLRQARGTPPPDSLHRASRMALEHEHKHGFKLQSTIFPFKIFFNCLMKQVKFVLDLFSPFVLMYFRIHPLLKAGCLTPPQWPGSTRVSPHLPEIPPQST